jgi:hypothetical protein
MTGVEENEMMVRQAHVQQNKAAFLDCVVESHVTSKLKQMVGSLAA